MSVVTKATSFKDESTLEREGDGAKVHDSRDPGCACTLRAARHPGFSFYTRYAAAPVDCLYLPILTLSLRYELMLIP